MNDEITLEELEGFSFQMGKQGRLYPRLVTNDTFAHAMYFVTKTIKNHKEVFNELSESEQAKLFHNLVAKIIFDHEDKKYYHELRERVIVYFRKRYANTEMVSETFKAFELELYYPCLCGAMTFVEKLLIDVEHPCNTQYSKLLETKVNTLLKITDNQRENLLLRSNLSGYIEFLSESVPFSGKEPEDINRHWLLHGRANRKIIEPDCLNIFMLLDILIELNEKIEVDPSCPTSPVS